MAVVNLVFGLIAGDTDALGIDDNDIIACIHVRGILGLVFATQSARDLCRQPAESFPICINKIPVLLDILGGRCESFHL